MIPSVISSGESWFKLFVPHRTTTFKCFWQHEYYENAIEHVELYHLQSHNLMLLGAAGKGIVMIMIRDNEV